MYKRQVSGARELLETEKDNDMREFLNDEIESKKTVLEDIEAELKELLLPKDLSLIHISEPTRPY